MTNWTLYKNNELLKERHWPGGDQLTDANKMIDIFSDSICNNKPTIVIYESLMGAGKSAVAMHVAKELGRTIIVVPAKPHQKQYKEYENIKYILKDNKKLNVMVVMGRENFECLYSKDKGLSVNCNNKNLPCKRRTNNGELRFMAACECKYYIPNPMLKIHAETMKNKFYKNSKNLFICGKNNNNKEEVNNTQVNLYDEMIQLTHTTKTESYISKRGETLVFIRENNTEVCPYYKQFYSYTNADIIVMNIAKWRVETETMNRKPISKLEIIDEADYFLDNIEKSFEITRKDIEYINSNTSTQISTLKRQTLELFVKCSFDILSKMKKGYCKYVKLSDSPIYKEMLESTNSLYDEYARYRWEDEKYYGVELKRILKNIDKGTISYNEFGDKLIMAMAYPDDLLKSLLENSSRNIIMMSGTFQEKIVLEKYYGINEINYNISHLKGRIEPISYPIIPQDEKSIILMKDFNYQNWQEESYKNEYIEKLYYAIEKMKHSLNYGIYTQQHNSPYGKILILSNAKKYIEHLKERKDIFVDIDKNPSEEDNFNTKKRVIAATTQKIGRGMDLHDDLCRGIIIPKYPFPDMSDLLYLARQERFGDFHWNIDKDKADREIIQTLSRGLRHENDWVIVVTLDPKVLQVLRKTTKKYYDINEKKNNKKI